MIPGSAHASCFGRALPPLLLSLLLSQFLVAPAAWADAGYRYWTYWTVSDGRWIFSPIGPGAKSIVDGDVQGWRFTVTTSASASSDQPRTSPTAAFDRICGGVTAAPGSARVAMVIDTGTIESAPAGQAVPPARGACAVIKESGTGADSLMAIAQPRVEGGLICAIDSYPQGECAVTVDVVPAKSTDHITDVLDSATPHETLPTEPGPAGPLSAGPGSAEPFPVETGSPAAMIGVGFVLAVGLLIGWMIRRRRL